MAKRYTVYINRYDADKTPASYVQEYEVTYHPSQTVLEVLAEIQGYQDDSLSFRSSCEAGKCGSCAVELNGRPVLACRTMVDGSDLHIGPLPHFPVIKDLIVDREQYERDFIQTVLSSGAADSSGQPVAALPESEIDYADLSCCIGCLICNAACPVAAQMKDRYPSPAVITEVLGAGVRIDKDGEKQAPIKENIDFCSLCLNCQVACPSGVSLDRINARAKDAYAREKGRRLRDWMLGRAELMGKLGSIFPSLSRRILANPLVRHGMQAALGISSKAEMVPYDKSLKHWINHRSSKTEAASAKRKVVYFIGCYTHYNDTDAGKDTIAVLEHLGINVEIPKQHCCGLPMIGNGDIDAARKVAEANIASLQPCCDQGYDIIVSCTSGSFMIKQGYTEVLELEHAADLAARTYDLGEYLRRLSETDEVQIQVKPVPLFAAYHTPCHLRAQKIGLPFVDILSKIPELKIEVLDAICCGQSGTYGFKAEKHDISIEVGRHLSESLNQLKPDIGLSECGPCQIRMHEVSGIPVAHPISILRRALDLTDK